MKEYPRREKIINFKKAMKKQDPIGYNKYFTSKQELHPDQNHKSLSENSPWAKMVMDDLQHPKPTHGCRGPHEIFVTSSQVDEIYPGGWNLDCIVI